MSNDHSSAESASTEETLRALDQRGAQAVLALDVAALDALYSPDHLLHAPDSVVRQKHEVLAAVQNSRSSLPARDGWSSIARSCST